MRRFRHTKPSDNLPRRLREEIEELGNMAEFFAGYEYLKEIDTKEISE